MKTNATWLLLGIFLLAASVAAQGTPVNTLFSVSDVQVEPGQSFVLDVEMTNNTTPIAGIRIPLEFDENYLTFDSVSFIGTVLPASSNLQSVVDDTGYINIVFLPNISSPDTLYAFSGLIATIHGSAKVTTPPSNYVVDSINTEAYGGLVKIRCEMSGASGQVTYLPKFESGTVSVNTPTAIEDEAGGALPTEFALAQNYPNPFNPATTIEFALPRSGHVELSIFNVLGQKVDVLLDQQMAAGSHTIEWDASNQPSGIYFYRIATSSGVDTKKMSLIK